MTDVLTEIRRHRVLPVLVVPERACAHGLGEALLDGGLPLAEVTLRTPDAVAVIGDLGEVPGLVVGAGTVVSPHQVARAVAAGARFVVSPGFSAAVVRECQQLDVPVFPGVATASEVMAALDAGIEVVKFFPAAAAGGIATVRALAGPFPDVRFIPTGGITSDTYLSYLELPQVAAVGGSWMVEASLLAQRRFEEITQRVRRVAGSEERVTAWPC